MLCETDRGEGNDVMHSRKQVVLRLKSFVRKQQEQLTRCAEEMASMQMQSRVEQESLQERVVLLEKGTVRQKRRNEELLQELRAVNEKAKDALARCRAAEEREEEACIARVCFHFGRSSFSLSSLLYSFASALSLSLLLSLPRFLCFPSTIRLTMCWDSPVFDPRCLPAFVQKRKGRLRFQTGSSPAGGHCRV